MDVFGRERQIKLFNGTGLGVMCGTKLSLVFVGCTPTGADDRQGGAVGLLMTQAV